MYEIYEGGGGRDGYAGIIAYASGQWAYTGPPGTSPSVTMNVTLNCSGSLNIHGREGFTGGSTASSGAGVYAEAYGMVSPPQTNNDAFAGVERAENSLPSILGSGCISTIYQTNETTSSSYSFYYNADNQYSISCTSSYETTPGTATITGTAYISCEAVASFQGYVGGGLGARVWGEANASGTTDAIVDIQLEQP